MNTGAFYGTRHKDLHPVVPNNADDSDDGLDDEDDVEDPDYNSCTGGDNATESDDSEDDDQNVPAHEEGNAPAQQPKKPCGKERRIGQENFVVMEPSHELPCEPLLRERQWRKRDIANLSTRD